nr:zinc-dependent metalloprotease [Serratia sp. PAMC26656]
QILTYWYKQMEHVMSLIGGYQIQYKCPSQLGGVYTPIPRIVQEEAMTFLIKHAFSAPEWLVNPSFSDTFKYSTYRDQLMEYQKLVLFELISQRRMKRFGRMEF